MPQASMHALRQHEEYYLENTLISVSISSVSLRKKNASTAQGSPNFWGVEMKVHSMDLSGHVLLVFARNILESPRHRFRQFQENKTMWEKACVVSTD